LIWGADPNVFDQVVDAMHVRSQWGIHPSEGVVLSLGRLVKKKGLQYLLQAIPRVLERVPNTRFVIAGSGPELDALREQADQLSVLEQVVFPGEVRWNDVPNVLKMCDIFVVPSVHDENGNVDGLPTTILEAMAAGRPVVASNVAGIPLAVIDRETGMLVDEANSMQLAEAITELLLSPDLAKEYGLAGRARVEAELNWNSVARKFVEFYNLGCDVS
jgi:glycosyltransferase involved in cell wall biosynthesis